MLFRNFLSVTIVAVASLGCGRSQERGQPKDAESEDSLTNDVKNQKSTSYIKVDQPTLLTIYLDTIELEVLQKKYGDDDFFTIADDMMYYNALILDKFDSLKIPTVSSSLSITHLITPNDTLLITKDSTFAFATYFYFDGKTLNRKDGFELLEP